MPLSSLSVYLMPERDYSSVAIARQINCLEILKVLSKDVKKNEIRLIQWMLIKSDIHQSPNNTNILEDQLGLIFITLLHMTLFGSPPLKMYLNSFPCGTPPIRPNHHLPVYGFDEILIWHPKEHFSCFKDKHSLWCNGLGMYSDWGIFHPVE